MRLLRQSLVRRWRPVLLTSAEGWLTAECAKAGIPVICEPFPNSRSLLAQAWGNGAFAERVACRLREASLVPTIVHGNDHPEGVLGLEIASRFAARTVIFLRSSAMTRRDYLKYRCNEYDIVATVCSLLHARTGAWQSGGKLRQVFDGLEEDDFAPPKPKAGRPPRRILVVGSPSAAKGWADFTEALHILEKEGAIDSLGVDFTGDAPDPAENDLHLARLKSVDACFLGRVEAFHDLLRKYELVVLPSRMECFGTAALETLAAGVPLISTQTGAVVSVLDNPDLLVPPQRPDRLAAALKNVFERWGEIDFGIASAQEKIRRLYLVHRAAESLDGIYRELTIGAYAAAVREVRHVNA